MLVPTTFDRGVWLYGPTGADAVEGAATDASYGLQVGGCTYGPTTEGMHCTLRGPFGQEIAAAAGDLLQALLVVRYRLPHGWVVLVQGARRDAWHGTDEHPCASDLARLYPQFSHPPADEPVDVLATLGEDEVGLVSTAREQVAYHQEWAGKSTLWSQLRTASA